MQKKPAGGIARNAFPFPVVWKAVKKEKFKIMKDNIGRDHVATKRTGDSFVFMNSHNHRPSNMQEHVLVIKADDGDDFRSYLCITSIFWEDFGWNWTWTCWYL